MRITVEPSRRMRVREVEAAPYVWKYPTIVEPNPEGGLGVREFELHLSYKNEYLSGIFYMEWPEGPLTASFAPISDTVFNPVKMMGGEPAGLWDDVFIEFEVDSNGDVLKFEARTILDDLWMTGTRID